MEQNVADDLVRIRIDRARKGRITGWLVRCAGCPDLAEPVETQKKWAEARARVHGSEVHEDHVLIMIPRGG